MSGKIPKAASSKAVKSTPKSAPTSKPATEAQPSSNSSLKGDLKEVHAQRSDIFNDPISKARENIEAEESNNRQGSSNQLAGKTYSPSSPANMAKSPAEKAKEALNTSQSQAVKDKVAAATRTKKEQEKAEQYKNDPFKKQTDKIKKDIKRKGRKENPIKKGLKRSTSAALEDSGKQPKEKRKKFIDKVKDRAAEETSPENMAKRAKQYKKITKIAGFIYTHWLQLLIALIIALILYFLVIPAVQIISWKIGNTPHYYCDLEASPGIKSSLVYKQYCGSNSGGNESIAEAAVSLAYNIENINQFETTFVASMCSSGVSHSSRAKTGGAAPDDIALKLFVDVHDEVLKGDGYYASCDRGVATTVRWAGADDNYPAGPCPSQLSYLEKHSEKWEYVGEAENEEMLQPGDIFINSHHTGIYVGEEAMQKTYPGSPHKTCAASYGDHCFQTQDLDHWLRGHSKGGKYKVFRNIQPESASQYKDLQF